MMSTETYVMMLQRSLLLSGVRQKYNRTLARLEGGRSQGDTRSSMNLTV